MTEALLTTERLRLRRPGPQDLEPSIRFFRSQRARWAGYAATRADAWRGFCVELAHWDLRGYGMFALTTHDDDACLGLVGPWFPEGRPEFELGWVLFDGAEGKGYAFEATVAARGYVYEVLGWETVVSYINEDNTRSIALAERLGAVLDPYAETLAPDCRVYRHPAPSELGA